METCYGSFRAAVLTCSTAENAANLPYRSSFHQRLTSVFKEVVHLRSQGAKARGCAE